MSESIYHPPSSSPIEYNSLEQVGKQFKIKEPGKLPSICVGCGTESDLVKVQDKLRYVNPIIILWILLSPLALIIAYFVCRKDVNIEFERCSACQKKKTLWSKISLFSWLGFVGAIILRFLFEGTTGFIFAAMIFIFLLLALYASAMKDPGFSIKSYNSPYFYLKGFNKMVADKMGKS
ncbi:hypothetical protein EUZ85_15410 [Hahella sp. KA22]|uniref:hypothetical protein n=1 Tax=Hahella sp. KA22 TaxID=1628392 RepID=UPI000FDDBF9F|nr:hypothetical protein [Hahella sp. KA22]AZZ92046.1 hypothetical protein ENC22_12845 [Hahella sp. KA22]QAY55417.1 hypothetical protein EUZ85_15410 [Hahella sp. KA22]